MEMTSFAPEESLGGADWFPHADTYTETRILPPYAIRIAFSRTQRLIKFFLILFHFKSARYSSTVY